MIRKVGTGFSEEIMRKYRDGFAGTGEETELLSRPESRQIKS